MVTCCRMMVVRLVFLLLATTVLKAKSDGLPSFRNIPKIMQDFKQSNELSMKERLSAPAVGRPSAMDIARTLLKKLPTNITDVCANQTLFLLNNLASPWALQMLDALGKPPSGILEGTFVWLGDFDECIGVSLPQGSEQSFHGQYCKLSYPVQTMGTPATLTIGACFPSGCSNGDATALANTVLNILGASNSSGFTSDCHMTDRPYDTGAYIAIVICSLFAGLLLVGTAYDITKTLHSSYSSKGEESMPLLNGGGAQLQERGTTSSSSLSVGSKLLISFSYYSNAKKLLSTAQGDRSLACLNGIRFISMCWVILGHAYVFTTAVMSDPAIAYKQVLPRRSFQVIFNASVSVDSFFLLSGLLVTYITVKEFEKRNGNFSLKEWITLYVHRYIRLTAVYAMLLMIWACLANHFYEGPLWPSSGSLDPSCSKYWWTNLLYINNFIPSKSDGVASCMDWTWYMANDMQFFIITPILALLLYRVWYIGVAVTSVLTIASVGAAAAISMSDSLGMSFKGAENPGQAGDWFEDLYEKPWCRFNAYGVGVLLGYLLYRKKSKVTLPVPLVICGWLLAALTCLTIIYAPYDAEFGSRAATVTSSESAAYNSMSRVCWCIGLGWVIYACATGYGGWINTFLSWKVFGPLARLTYCAYLIHPILYTVSALGSRDTLHFDDVTVTLKFIGILVMSMAFAFVSSLSFEAPIMGVEKLLLHSNKKN